MNILAILFLASAGCWFGLWLNSRSSSRLRLLESRRHLEKLRRELNKLKK